MRVKVGYLRGRCSQCGRVHVQPRHAGDIIVCDCYKYCPLCGAEMEPYSPDMDPKTYRIEGKTDVKALGHAQPPEWTLATRRVCRNHTPPYYSDQQPMRE